MGYFTRFLVSIGGMLGKGDQMMVFKRYMYLIILTVVLILFLVMYLLQDVPPTVRRELIVEEEFSQEVVDVTFKIHTLDESRFLEVHAKSMVEYPHPEDSIIYLLEAYLYEKDEALLKLLGDVGYLSSIRDRFKVESPLVFKGEMAFFTSGYLLWEVRDGFIYGEEGIEYNDEMFVVTADSLFYDPGTRKIYLKDNVRLSFHEGGGVR